MAYFQKTIRPDIIDGDVSKVVGSNIVTSPTEDTTNDVAFSNLDLVFDWTPIDVPLRVDSVTDGLIHMYGRMGLIQSPSLHLLIAKSNNGAAPTSLGNENSPITGCYELADILLGTMRFKHNFGLSLGGFAGTILRYNEDTGLYSGTGSAIPIEPEYNSLGGKTTNRIYVACVYTGVGTQYLNFRTGVQPTAQATTSTDTIAIDGIDPNRVFRVGDTIYTNTDDTALGTIKSMTWGGSSGTIVLNANLAAQVEDNEELVNAKPMTVTLSFDIGRS